MANLNQSNPLRVKIGDIVKYTVKDLYDTLVYSGKVVAICDYESARAYADVLAIHQGMVAADSTLGNNELSTYRFMIIECNDKVRRPVAFSVDGSNSWFTNNELEIITEGHEYTIKLFDANASDAALALRVLNEQGFSCRIIEEK